MKKSIFSFSGTLSISLLLLACNKQDSGLTQTANPTSGQTSSAINGSFTISSFRQKNEDKTSQFGGYVFTFTSTGTNQGNITTVKGTNSVNGNWVYSPAVTYYGSTSKTSITLSFSAVSPFTLLNKTWNVDSTSTSSELDLSSPELAEDEHVHFLKQ